MTLKLRWYHFRLWLYARLSDILRTRAPLAVYLWFTRFNPVGKPRKPHNIDFDKEY